MCKDETIDLSESLELSVDDDLSVDYVQSDLNQTTAMLPSDCGEDYATYPPCGIQKSELFDLVESFIAAEKVPLQGRHYAAGERLMQQGQPSPGLFLVDSGDVEILDAAGGRRIDRQSGPALFGEMSLLTGGTCSADVVAIGDVEVRVWEAEDYHQFRGTHPELETMLGRLVSTRLGHHDHDALCGKPIGRYLVERCIARGGMGVVYAARDSMGTRVALKMLMHKFVHDQSMHRRFDAETKLLQSLNHPNINRMSEHFVDYRTRFLVLELCEGTDLAGLIRRGGPLPTEIARRVLGQIAAGLDYAHQRDIVHRDLKAANLLVSRDGVVQIADFGLSRLRQIDAPDSLIVGTPSCMAPELFEMRDSGMAADWYALGCLLYHLLSGRQLFTEGNIGQLFQAKKQFDPERDLSAEHFKSAGREQTIDAELLAVLREMLRTDPLERKIDLEYLSGWAEPIGDYSSPPIE